MDQPIGQLGTIEAFIYTCKAALAGIVAFLLCRAFWVPGEVWAVVSTLIVIQPSLHPSLRASTTRVAANLIAAVVGAAYSQLLGHPLLALVLGIMTVGMIIHHTRLDDGLRAGYAAVAIVTLTPAGSGWVGAFDRVGAVLLGCACALLVNVVFDWVTTKTGGTARGTKPNPQDSE